MSSGLTEAVFDLYPQRPRVAILMSGSGSNAESLLTDEEIRDRYDVRAIVTDNSMSNARPLSEAFGLDLLDRNATRFTDSGEREEYFSSLIRSLGSRGVEAVFYAGFMKISTPAFCETFPGVNVHPADLTILDDSGIAKYRGMNAMPDMRRDLGFVRSTVHVADCPVDTGSAISITGAVIPEASETNAELHQRLKRYEHAIYVGTLQSIARSEIVLSDIPFYGFATEGDKNEQ